MELTELEGAILGVVASREPCSAYAVRKRFEASPTSGWSCSKGAIYPAVRRMIARGLIEAVKSMRGRQQSEQLRLSARGRRYLAGWIGSFPSGIGGAPVDPLRTRVNYLAALAPEERSAFLERAEHEVRLALKAALRAQGDAEVRDLWDLEASRLGVRMQIEAKLAWVQAVRAMIGPGGEPAPSASPGSPSPSG